MDLDLSDTQLLVQKTARDFATRVVAPQAAEADATERFPREALKGLADLGLMAINVPPELGGSGAGVIAYALAMQEIARACASTAVMMSVNNMVGEAIARFGTDAQKQHHCPKLASGEHTNGSFALSEPDAGSDPGGMRTTAKRDGDEWVIDGAKQFITNAGTDISGLVCITAVTSGNQPNETATAGHAGAGEGANTNANGKEISNIIVANGTPGYEQGEPYRKMGWNASDTRPLSFSDCRVPEQNLLGPRGAGFKQFLQILDIGRIGVAAMGVGLAQGALDEALKYAKQRKAFGKSISKFQAIQAKLADMSTEIEAGRLLVYKAAREKDHGRNFTLTAAQAKLKTGRLAVRCAEEAVQIHGGYGFIEEYPVCRFYRDAKILTIGEGTDEVQQMVIARALGA